MSYTTQLKIFWQAIQKTEGLVRPQRPRATDPYEQNRPSPPESIQRCLQNACSGATESCRQKRHEGLLQWTEGSVGTQEEWTCSAEINRWNGDLLW
ncbi:hypothetical protein NP493_136g01002 [Ridgeia piscesae]|uniref:Uncharacterized protein n=1 Tax=Ridgeia piscesae TaxID=27915 RepID=A0AAD9UGB2_RIDPI|nr:hypothetical protein NP493_136g01002 [Ridgeia piscesae]